MIGTHLSGLLAHNHASAMELQNGVLYPVSPEVAMFGTLQPDLATDDANILLRALDHARFEGSDSQVLETLTRRLPSPTRETAWEQDYGLALETLDRLDVIEDAKTYVDIDAVLRSLDVDVVTVAVQDLALRGVAIAGTGFRPTVLVNGRTPRNRSAPGRRFTLAHELGHILVDRGRARRVTHSSTPWAPEAIERRANAFAAMFLMPYRVVDAALSRAGGVTGHAALVKVARTLRCGRTAVLEHLKNIDRIDVSTYFRVRAELDELR